MVKSKKDSPHPLPELLERDDLVQLNRAIKEMKSEEPGRQKGGQQGRKEDNRSRSDKFQQYQMDVVGDWECLPRDQQKGVGKV